MDHLIKVISHSILHKMACTVLCYVGIAIAALVILILCWMWYMGLMKLLCFFIVII